MDGTVAAGSLAGAGGGYDELLAVLDGHLAGKSDREVAEDLYGHDRVAAEWREDSWMRSAVRRRVKKALMIMNRGYRDLAAGRRLAG